MWTDTTRAQHALKGLALPNDLTDAEWVLLEPFLLGAIIWLLGDVQGRAARLADEHAQIV
jgi:hypothetical protein